MANNRMFILHRPTGKAVFLGKRMGGLWYDVPRKLSLSLDSLFDAAGFDGLDDYCLMLEDTDGATGAIQIDDYRQFEFVRIPEIPMRSALITPLWRCTPSQLWYRFRWWLVHRLYALVHWLDTEPERA